MRFCCFASAMIRSASAMSRHIGFSVRTWAPALSAARITSACRGSGVATASTSRSGKARRISCHGFGPAKAFGAWPVQRLKLLPGAPGGLFCARGHCGKLELDGRQIPRPTVQSHASELRADAGALQIGIGPRVHVAAEHARAHECNLDCAVHRKVGQVSRLSHVCSRRMCRVNQNEAIHFSSSLFPVGWLVGFPLKDQALAGAPALALCPFPASRRPLRTQLGAPNSRASGPLLLQPCTRPSRGTPRRLAVDNIVIYGESPGGLRWSYGGMGGR